MTTGMSGVRRLETRRRLTSGDRLLVCALFAVLSQGCAVPPDDAPDAGALGGGAGAIAATAPIKLKVVVQPYLAHAPLFIAQDESLFVRQGLDVEFVPMARATDAVPLLLRGDVDVLASALVPGLLNAMARGESLRIVADRGYLDPVGCTHYAIVVRPGLIREGRLLQKVRRISIERQAAVLYIVEKSLSFAGASLDTMEALEVPPVPEAEALADGTLDAALAGEPWLSRIVQSGRGQIWIASNKAVPGLQTSTVLFGPSILTRNLEGGRRFMVAYRQALAQYLEGKTPRNVALLARVTGDTPELVRKSCWPAVRASGRIDVASLLQYQDWAKQKGYVPVGATAAQLWDSTFVVYADSVLRRSRYTLSH